MKITIITWSHTDETIAITLTWLHSYEFKPYGTINWVIPGYQVSAYHFPTLARPIHSSQKEAAIRLVRMSGYPVIVDDQTLR